MLLRLSSGISVCLIICLSSITLFADSDEQYFTDYSNDIQIIFEKMIKDNQSNKQIFENNALSDKTLELKAMTFNMGLLGVFWFKTKDYKKRSKILDKTLSDFLTNEKPDIVLLQELWHRTDFNTVVATAKKNGYIPVLTDYRGIKEGTKVSPKHHGLQILINENIMESEKSLHNIALDRYQNRARWESLELIYRGLLSCSIKLKDSGRELFIGTTHLTPSQGNHKIRKKQVKSIGDILKNKMSSVAKTDFILLGGDFNSSPDYTQKEWEENKLAYIDFYSHTGLMDTFKAGNPDGGYTPHDTVSPKYRIDFLWFGGNQITRDKNYPSASRFYIKDSRSVFDKPVEGDIYMSDHQGVLSDVVIFDTNQD